MPDNCIGLYIVFEMRLKRVTTNKSEKSIDIYNALIVNNGMILVRPLSELTIDCRLTTDQWSNRLRLNERKTLGHGVKSCAGAT